jgi:hypothetical protein
MKLEFLDRFPKNTRTAIFISQCCSHLSAQFRTNFQTIEIFMKVCPLRGGLFHADGRTDGRTGRRTRLKLLVDFRNFAYAPKKQLDKTLKLRSSGLRRRVVWMTSNIVSYKHAACIFRYGPLILTLSSILKMKATIPFENDGCCTNLPSYVSSHPNIVLTVFKLQYHISCSLT